VHQINRLITGWIEDGVNGFIVDPTNQNIIGNINSVIEKIPIPNFKKIGEGINNAFKDVGNWFSNTLGRRLEDITDDEWAQMDPYTRKHLNDSVHGRRLVEYAGNGLPLIPLIPRMCLEDMPYRPNKCAGGGITPAEAAKFAACEDPKLAGGMDNLCYYQRVRPPHVSIMHVQCPRMCTACTGAQNLQQGRVDQKVRRHVRQGLRESRRPEQTVRDGVRQQLLLDGSNNVRVAAGRGDLSNVGARQDRAARDLLEPRVRHGHVARSGALASPRVW
jgi:hypothetical protein